MTANTPTRKPARCVLDGAYKVDTLEKIVNFIQNQSQLLAAVNVIKGTELFQHGGNYYADSRGFTADNSTIYFYRTTEGINVILTYEGHSYKVGETNVIRANMTAHSEDHDDLDRLVDKIDKIKKYLN